MTTNLERMIELAEKTFATRKDPRQISVTEEVMERLRRIHPATLTEQDDGNGPVAWVLVLPTTHDLMVRFIAKQTNEQELLEETLRPRKKHRGRQAQGDTPFQGKYDALYLCSALVLPEYRGKGLAKRLICAAIKSIQADHPIKYLFYWAFSVEGKRLAEAVAKEIGLPLLKRSA